MPVHSDAAALAHFLGTIRCRVTWRRFHEDLVYLCLQVFRVGADLRGRDDGSRLVSETNDFDSRQFKGNAEGIG